MKFFDHRLLVAVGMLLSIPISFSQTHFSCGLPDKLETLYATYPNLETDQQELIERSKHYRSTLGGDREAVYTIPVVFHIIHEHGNENISDEQIYDQMAILNRDFRKLNADTTDIVTEFKELAADTHIEFRLANRDPYGNCTNGIEHIYSHETSNGDDYSKLNQWPRNRYLNVWIVKSMRDGVAGYAYYPSAVSGGLQYADGIIILNNYIGSIGTSNLTNSRALTHEIGHWLGLPHTWGNTNSPEVSCGDDDIEDTPETAGHTTCELDDDLCTPGVIENVQNYMEYSYCSNMFTIGQSDVMRLTLETPTSNRNNLHTTFNQESAGILEEPTLCTPLPDFYVKEQVFCVGNNIRFYPSVSRAGVETYSWSFPGGTPAVSNEASPVVSYETPGVYPVTLSVTNAAGTETITKTDYAHALADYWQHEGAYAEDFENDHFDTQSWIVLNPQDDEVKWEQVDHVGYSGSNSLALKYYRASPNPILYPHYYDRMGGAKEVLITPAYNLSNTTAAVLSFKYIFATVNGGSYDPSNLEMRVFYRQGCNTSWNPLTILNADQLVCYGYVGESFTPSGDSEWQSVELNLPGVIDATNVRFKFEFTAEDHMNNFYLDDLNLSGVVSNGPEMDAVQNVQLYPNPSNSNDPIQLTYYSANGKSVNVTLYDMLGHQLTSQTLASTPGMNTHQLDWAENNLSGGMYHVVLTSETTTITKRLILE